MRISQFAYAQVGNGPVFVAMGRGVADIFLAQDVTLVYSGTCTGLMDVVADTILQGGGEEICVVPTGLWPLEGDHQRMTRQENVTTLAERKERMIELTDVFIYLPDGLDTFDVFFEPLTLAQLCQYRKSVVLFDVADYFQLICWLLGMYLQGSLSDPSHDGATRQIADTNPFYMVDILRQVIGTSMLQVVRGPESQSIPPTIITDETVPHSCLYGSVTSKHVVSPLWSFGGDGGDNNA